MVVTEVELTKVMNNLLLDNLYEFRSVLQHKKVLELHHYTKFNQVDIWYKFLRTEIGMDLESEFTLPEYEYCYWDTLDNKKLRRKHRKKMKKKS